MAQARQLERVIERLSDLTIIHHVENDGTIWATKGRQVITIRNGVRSQIAKFPAVMPRDLFKFHRLAERAARADKCNIYVNRMGQVLGIRGGIVYRLCASEARALGSINGDCVLHRGICEDDTGNMYFGEYFMNPSRIPVRIWRVSTDWKLEVVHEFTSPKVRHVHGVFRDPFQADSLWLTTGDYSGECYIFCSKDRFSSLSKFGDGEQQYRAVTLYFTKKHISWITDSHIEQNYSCRISRETGEFETGQDIDASAWYGTTTREGMHVAFTTVEKGPAIKTNYCQVLVSMDGFVWSELMRFKKDRYRPMRIFKYGVLSCPSGMMENKAIYLSGEGLVGLDGKSQKISLEHAAV